MKLEDLTPKQRLKAEKWLAIIRECINSDLSNEEWCEQNNVSIKSYYYYLAKLRKMALTLNSKKWCNTRYLIIEYASFLFVYLLDNNLLLSDLIFWIDLLRILCWLIDL